MIARFPRRAKSATLGRLGGVTLDNLIGQRDTEKREGHPEDAGQAERAVGCAEQYGGLAFLHPGYVLLEHACHPDEEQCGNEYVNDGTRLANQLGTEVVHDPI